MWLWTWIAQSPVTSTFRSWFSWNARAHTVLGVCAAYQHPTWHWGPDAGRQMTLEHVVCSGGTPWLTRIFAPVSPLKQHWNSPLDTMVYERNKNFSDLNNNKPLDSYELDFISHAIVLKEFHAHSVNRRILSVIKLIFIEFWIICSQLSWHAWPHPAWCSIKVETVQFQYWFSFFKRHSILKGNKNGDKYLGDVEKKVLPHRSSGCLFMK